METWKQFLASLETKGGTIFVLLLLIPVSVGITLVAKLYGMDVAAMIIVTNVFTALFTALSTTRTKNGDGVKTPERESPGI